MMRLLLSLLLLLSFLQMNAQTYPKVILPGDYPDPSIMRDGKDYYMTHSPFYYAPGFLIWHSQDLMNWEPLCRVMPQYEGSAMYNPQIQISAESETKRSIFREKDKTKRSKKESAQHSKSRNKSFVMTSVSAL